MSHNNYFSGVKKPHNNYFSGVLASKIKKPPQAYDLKRLNLHYFYLREGALSHLR
ncbi:hypothetical protein LTSERUB_1710 [Salmonella enterica subsp. enterica serovar Rubislaw str. A4-653]|uniref:Uncharacterized protein n=1 Tax=Salmonella enterica subsp. enterica serovar Rubislaw str. A4-653 TaxID=913081 RepID=G5QGY9_SALRU|nr:hypothetical protein LTSERUB_1710 [Salmonella enterica subsp. enterica serovar Rubislaw str. A4-653]